MKHPFARRLFTGLLSVLPLTGAASPAPSLPPEARARRPQPPPPGSPLEQLPVDPQEKSRPEGRENVPSPQRDLGNPPIWVRQHGTGVFDQATAIAAAKTHIFTVGSTGGALDGNTSAGGQDLFLMKHSLAGHHEWTRQLGSAGHDYATGVAISRPEDPFIYVTGYTFSTLPGVPNSSAGSSDLFLTKYDNGGNPVWSRQLGSSGADNAQAVATDAAGNVYVAGYTTGHLDANTNLGLKDAFLVKYNANGEKQWTRLLGTSLNDEARAVTVDATGAIYIAGLTFGSLPGNTSSGDSDMFVARYSSAGVREWVKQLGTSDVDVAQGVTTTRAANGTVSVYVSGYTLGAFAGPRLGGYDAVVAQLSGAQGTPGWKVQRGSAGNDFAYGIASDGTETLYFTGTTNYDLGTNLSAGSNDVFLTELHAASGAHKRSRQLGSTHADGSWDEGDIAFGVTRIPADGIYVAGYTEGEFADTLLAGGKDVLIAKYFENCTTAGPRECDGALGTGDPHLMTFDRATYDFQAVGEFILAESTSGAPFTLQGRMAGYNPHISVISAVATRVGTDRVAIYRGYPTALVRINGVDTAITGTVALSGGGSLSLQSGTLVVEWPSSERMTVSNRGGLLDVQLLVPPFRRGSVRGLFGNDNGLAGDDFTRRDGTPMAAPLSFQELYRGPTSFAQSWRITQAESLFDYGLNQDTGTFTDLNAPYAWASIHDFTPQERLDAEAICTSAGVTLPFALEACILDVGMTGDASFASSAAGAQSFVQVESPDNVPPPAPQPFYTQSFNGTVGPEWSSSQTSTSPVGSRKYLGALGNAQVTLEARNMPDHSKVTVTFDVFVMGGWAGNTWGVNIDGVGEQRTTFSNTAAAQAFPEWDTLASHAARSGAVEVNTLGSVGGDTVYRVKLTVDHMDPALRLDFFAEGLSASQTWGLDNVEVQVQ